MPPLTQDHRTCRLSIPGKEQLNLVFRSMTAFERISTPFEFRVLAMTEQPIAKVDDLLGEPCVVAYHGDDGPLRHFHGTCAQVTFAGNDTSGDYLYQLVLRPDFWMMTRNRDCRIYQNMEVRDIISELLQRGRVKNDFKLEGTYPKRVYCVQYRESDFTFISRLMEEEGIFYFFKHDAGSHKMIIADRSSVHEAVPNFSEVPYYPPTERSSRERDHLDEWSQQHNVATANYKLADFNFEKPAPIFESKTGLGGAHRGDEIEAIDYPGGFLDSSEGKRYAEIRAQAERALRVVATASGNSMGLAAGAKFSLTGHPIDGENADYVIVETRHRMENDAYHSGGSLGHPDRVDILAIPAATPFRSRQLTARPRIIGTQTAIVTGPGGEEIETDKYGRIRVVFHWDTHGRDDRPSSCWVRVAQTSAGAGWGSVFTPRIGQEVLVEFVDGDPDRPIVTGVVYNGDNASPLNLPGEKTQSTIKTNSSKGGGGFNQIRFEDKKGSEEIFIQAQKDYNTKILNNETRTIGNDRTTTIEQGNETYTLKKGDRAEAIEMGSDSLKIKMGDQNVKLDLGKQSTEAMQSIEFTVGQSSIKIDQMGVTIKGMMIKVEGTITAEVKGLMTSVKGDAMLIAKGGITMIN